MNASLTAAEITDRPRILPRGSETLLTEMTPQFINYRAIEWDRVTRTRYFFGQRFRYEYPGPVRDLRQRLIAVPADRCGDQRLCEHALTVDPPPAAIRRSVDRFGNRHDEFEVARVERAATFDVSLTLERTNDRGETPTTDLLSADQIRLFLQPTDLTRPDHRIAEIARELRAHSRDDQDLAEHIGDWVHRAMTYGSGSTDVKTDAAQALSTGRGLCQDFAHLMIALCREAALPARYVSGHMLGEGASHAWVEVLLPNRAAKGVEVVALDPTNRRRPNLKYITVARGRDYRDVAPTSGSFTAPYQGRLHYTKNAGLTLVEYDDGQIVAGG